MTGLISRLWGCFRRQSKGVAHRIVTIPDPLPVALYCPGCGVEMFTSPRVLLGSVGPDGRRWIFWCPCGQSSEWDFTGRQPVRVLVR